MCGVLFFRSDSLGVTTQRLDEALSLMESRGPDQWSSERYKNAYLGHRRLSIIDIGERSKQPFESTDGRYAMIYNGEIYNYKEVREKFGLETRTDSDTEVLLQLYIMLGAGCLQHLNGIFSFVVFDKLSGNVFAARDRLGVKPLYYHVRGRTLIYSSEIAPILHLIDDAEPDSVGIRQYLKARATFRGHTIYKNIQMLPPGSYHLNGKLKHYWTLKQTRENWNDEEIASLVESSIGYRLVSDVSIGSFLSGGLDSSIITALAKTEQSYTIGFAENNEFDWSEKVARHIGTDHAALTISNEQYLATNEWMVRRRKMPLSVPNEVLIYLMASEVSKKNKVVLSGEGADELFFGYDRIFKWAAGQDQWNMTDFDRLYSYGSHSDDQILRQILEPYDIYAKPLDRLAAFFQQDHLAGLFLRLDYATMLASVEAREPFADYRLVEYMFGAPMDYRMQAGEVKAPLKRIFGHLIPPENVHRKKVGFPVPLADIFGLGTHAQGMDAWLDYNMGLVFDDWIELKAQILGQINVGV